jgi:hypothetical protein
MQQNSTQGFMQTILGRQCGAKSTRYRALIKAWRELMVFSDAGRGPSRYAGCVGYQIDHLSEH